MADAAISGQRGTTIAFLLPVTLNGADFPVNGGAGYVVTFTAKRRRSDAVALITKTWRSPPGASDPGMTLLAGTDNTIDVELSPADTAAFTGTEFLVWDAILTEPNGRETPVAKGALTVRAGVGS